MLCIVRNFLAVPISGVDIENLFSTVRDIYYYRYSCLTPETIESLIIQITTDIFLFRENYRFFFDNNKYKKTDSRISGNKFEKLPSHFISDMEDLEKVKKNNKTDIFRDNFSERAVLLLLSTSQNKQFRVLISNRPRCAVTIYQEPGFFYQLNNGKIIK